MAPTLNIWKTSGGGYTDYSSWLWDGGSVSTPLFAKTHLVNTPQSVTFALQNGVPGLVVPDAGNRVQILTNSYGTWFTGYLSQVPQLQLLGADQNGNPVYGYKMTAVSEELRLEWQTSAIFPTLAPFANQTQGYIVKALITALGGGLDVTNVAAGTTIPFFRVKPDEAFADAVRRLSDKTNMAFWTKAGLAYYQPYSTALGYIPAESNTSFDPTLLTVNPVQNPVFNDVVGTGSVEPQGYVREFGVGDGLTAIWPLKFPCYGAQSQKLLQDNLTATSIDSTIWTLTGTNDPNGLFSMTGGSLKMLCASSTSPSRLTSISGIDVSGNLLLRAGRISFLGASNVIVGGLFVSDTGTLANCRAGFSCVPYPFGSQTQINPILSAGVIASPAYVTKPNKIYQFQMLIDVNQQFRVERPFFSLFNNYGGATVPANASITWSVIELDNANPDAAAVEVLRYTTTYNNIEAFLFYSVLAGPQNTTDPVNLTANFCALYKPPQVEVWLYPASGLTADNFGAFGLSSNWFYNAGFFELGGATLDVYEGDLTNNFGLVRWGLGTFPNDQFAQMTITALDTTNATAIGPAVRVSTIGADTAYIFLVYGDGSCGLTKHVSGAINFLHSWPGGTIAVNDVVRLTVTGTQLVITQNGVQIFSGNDSSITSGAAGFGGFGGSLTGGTRATNWSATQVSITGWYRVQVGIDATDPLARCAITTGSDNNSQLEFVGLQQPDPQELLKIIYRSAGVARARVKKTSSITAEAAKAGDTGERTGTLPAQTPAPRNSAEFELACQAYIDDRTNPLFQGDWLMNTKAFPPGVEPEPGTLITVNAPTRYPQFQALVTEVDSNFYQQLADGSEYFEHDVKFGPLYRLDDMSVEFQPSDEALQGQLDTLVTQYPIEFASVGAAYAADVTQVDYVSKTPTTFLIDAGIAPTVAFEVRRTDAAWGTTNTVNSLIADPTTQQFSIPRLGNDITALVKNEDGSELVSRYFAAVRFRWPFIPMAPDLASFDVTTDPTHPIFTFALDPAEDPFNVYSIEVRDFDNVTVLLARTLVSYTDFQFTYNNVANLATIGLFVYFINLLGEYSQPYNVDVGIGNTIDGLDQAGPNLLVNPGFEVSSFAYPTGLQAGADQVIADGWVVYGGNSPQLLCEVESAGNARTGLRNGHIQLSPGVTIPANTQVVAFINAPTDTTTKLFPVRGSDTYYLGGWARFDSSVGFAPAGLSVDIRFEVDFFDTNGVFISTVPALTTPTFGQGWTEIDTTATVPQNAAFAQFRCGVILATGAGPFSTGSSVYVDARFDDCFFYKAQRNGHSSYRPVGLDGVSSINPLTAFDLSDSGNSVIDVVSFRMRSGTSDPVIAAGSLIVLSGTLYYIFYDDPGFVGGPVTFQATTSKEVALIGEGRYFVGSIATPLPGMAETFGNNDGGSGVQNGMTTILMGNNATYVVGFPLGTATITNPINMVDGDFTTFATASATANGSNNNTALMALTGFPSFTRRYSSLSARCIATVQSSSLVNANPNEPFFQATAVIHLGGSSFLIVLSPIANPFLAGFSLNFSPSTPTLFSAVLSGVLGGPFSSIFANPGNVELNVTLNLGADFTSGTVSVAIYQGWLEIVE